MIVLRNTSLETAAPSKTLGSGCAHCHVLFKRTSNSCRAENHDRLSERDCPALLRRYVPLDIALVHNPER